MTNGCPHSLLDINGHIKLTDLGLCKKVDMGNIDTINDSSIEVNPHVNAAMDQNIAADADPENQKLHKTSRPSHRDRALAYSTVGTPGEKPIGQPLSHYSCHFAVFGCLL